MRLIFCELQRGHSTPLGQRSSSRYARHSASVSNASESFTRSIAGCVVSAMAKDKKKVPALRTRTDEVVDWIFVKGAAKKLRELLDLEDEPRRRKQRKQDHDD